MNHPSRPALSAAAARLLPGSNAEREARERMAREAAEREEREMTFALAERYHRSGEPRLAFAQIREDLLRLQVVNNDLARAASGGGLDLKLVAKSASEIRKRAERLKENLALPEATEGEKVPPSQPPADAGSSGRRSRGSTESSSDSRTRCTRKASGASTWRRPPGSARLGGDHGAERAGQEGSESLGEAVR